jgi:hypothetical protein
LRTKSFIFPKICHSAIEAYKFFKKGKKSFLDLEILTLVEIGGGAKSMQM